MHSLAFLSQLGHWQIDFVAFALLLTSAVFTLCPEELIFFTLGFLAHYGRVSLVEAMIAAQLGLIPADALTVWFGRKLGNGMMTRKPFRKLLGREGVQRSLERLRTSGNSLLFFARFVPMLRAPVYLAAGVSGVPLRRAVLIDLLAAGIQIPGLVMLGFVLGQSAEHVMTLYAYIAPAALMAFILAKVARPALALRYQTSQRG